MFLSDETGSMTSAQSYIAENLVDIRDTITLLLESAPSCNRSALSGRPLEVDERANYDKNYVEQKYPKAAPELIERLGTAAWSRRQYLMELQLQAEPIKACFGAWERTTGERGKF